LWKELWTTFNRVTRTGCGEVLLSFGEAAEIARQIAQGLDTRTATA